MQRLRNGVAHLVCKARSDRCSKHGTPDLIIITFSFDDTMENLFVSSSATGTQTGPQHVCMLQGKITYQFCETTFCDDIIVPIAILLDTTAETLLAALKSRCPDVFRKFDDSVLFLVILNTDSAKSCLRLGRHFQFLSESESSKLHLQSLCMQHMLSQTLVFAASSLNFINGAFCSTVQLHKGSTMSSLGKRTKEFFDKNLTVVYEYNDEWRGHYQKNKAIVDLLLSSRDPGIDSSEHRSTEKGRRLAATKLIAWLPMLWCVVGNFAHYCPLGCCWSREESVEKCWSAFYTLLLSHRPKVPALNRWLGLYAPLSWWCFAMNFFFIHLLWLV